MQVIIKKIAWLMQITMKTSAVESLNAAANIFVGLVCTIIARDSSLGKSLNLFDFSDTNFH